MNREQEVVNFDDSEFLEKDVERRAAKKYMDAQNEAFEKEANEGKFKVITQVAETVAAIAVVLYILYEMWTSFPGIWGKLLVIGILLAAVSSIALRYLAKHYYMKGDRKKFKAFNTASKVTAVSLNMADTLLPGDKTIAKIEKTQVAVTKALSTGSKVSALDDDNTAYSSDNYDTYRRKCHVKGIEIVTEDRVKDVIEAVKEKVRESKLSTEDRRDIILMLYAVSDYHKGRCKDVIEECVYLQLLGALDAFSDTGIRNNLIPNIIPGYGYVDDMFMCNCVLSEHKDEIKKYRDWRAEYRKQKMIETKNIYLKQLEDSGRRVIESGRVIDVLRAFNGEGEDQGYTARLLFSMGNDCNAGSWSLDDRTYRLIVGAIAYWVKDADYIPDHEVDGKVDDKAVIRFVYNEIVDECNKYRWRDVGSALDSLIAQSSSGGE